jgi:hypothetical protein
VERNLKRNKAGREKRGERKRNKQVSLAANIIIIILLILLFDLL